MLEVLSRTPSSLTKPQVAEANSCALSTYLVYNWAVESVTSTPVLRVKPAALPEVSVARFEGVFLIWVTEVEPEEVLVS
jgi:hypothetical protein